MGKKKLPTKQPNFSLHRRDLFRLFGGGAFAYTVCPVSQILAMLVEGEINRALAQSSSSTAPRTLVLFDIEGGIQHWNWDNPMRPRGPTDSFYSNPMITTRFTNVDEGAGTFDMTFSDSQFGNYYMPYLWGLQMPTDGGGTTAMSNLLSNMFTIRGIDMEVDNHGGDNAKLVAPVPGGASITGIVADASSLNIPAVSVADLTLNVNAATAYSAPNKTGRVNIHAGYGSPANFASALLQPFDEANLTSFRSDSYLRQKIDQAIDLLQSFASTNAAATDAVFRDRTKAEDMFRSGIASLGDDSFTSLVTKYQGLVNRVLADRTIPGITDLAIRGIEFPFTISGEDKVAVSNVLTDSDPYANQYAFEGHLIGNPDVRTMFDTANLDVMAKNFAFAEYLVTNKLSSAITLMHHDFSTMTGMSITNSPVVSDLTTVTGISASNVGGNTQFTIGAGDLVSASNKEMRADAHETGAVPGLMITSLFYMSLSSCLYEFIDQLKTQSFDPSNSSDTRTMFDETVIQVGSEFERIARVSGRGSEHGFNGNTVSFFSGCIDQHLIIGNCYDQSQTYIRDDYPGTWGQAAPVQGVNGGLLKPGHITSSLATMLRVSPPSTANESLIRMNTSDKVEMAEGFETARNIVRTED